MERIFILAGERSGDLHASNLVAELRAQRPNLVIDGVGGNYLADKGVNLLFNYDALNYMGVVDVLLNIRSISQRLRQVEQHLLSAKPQVVILIDSAGFNLRVARFCKQNGIPVVYYILPKVWAWGKSRIAKLKKYTDHRIVILPFELEYFKAHGLQVDYFGNPITDELARFVPNPSFGERYHIIKPVIAILPGSRFQEVDNMLAKMVAIAPSFEDYQFVVAGVNNLPTDLYDQIPKTEQFRVVYSDTYNVLASASAALVTSGTATLETALLGIAQVVCYRSSAIFMLIARLLVKLKFISLVNLIANREVVKELIQEDFNTENLITELKRILPGGAHRAYVEEGYAGVKKLTGKADTSQRVASFILSTLPSI